MKSKRGPQRKLQRLKGPTNPGQAAPGELWEQQQQLKLAAAACKQTQQVHVSAEACANIARAQRRYEVHMPECTCEPGEHGAAETLQGLDGISVAETFNGATVLITGATGYIGSLVRTFIRSSLQKTPLLLSNLYILHVICESLVSRSDM